MTVLTKFRAFTIRARMLASIAIVVCLLGAVGGSGLWGMFRIERAGSNFIDGPFSDAVHLGALYLHFGEARKEEKSMIILFKQDLGQRREQWKLAMSESEGDLQSLRATATDPQTVELLDKLGKELAAYKKSFEEKVKNFSFYSDSGAVEQDLAYMQRSAEEAQKMMSLLQQRLQANSSQVQIGIGALSRATLYTFCCVLILSMAVVVGFTIVNLRSIVNPLGNAKRIASSIADGDLTLEVQESGRDECADLIRALDGMQASLHSTVLGVRRSAESISVASNEVASGAQDLSARTELSASSIQQSASSLQQVTDTVHSSSETARMARDLAGSASEIAEQGGEVVSRVVSTMADIHASSKHIAEITSLIDAISFQTNILALNAAVEAARAGDQGRGFAVVAGEVRALAKRSAQAAGEIRELIGTSVKKIEFGSELVNQAGTTMTEIVGSIRRAATMIGEVSDASTAQSERLGEVNTAVAQLEDMTQQNAALVEQSAAAAESLKEQAGKLMQLMQYFKADEVFSVSGGESPRHFAALR